ncbi:MAG: MarR family winged helix-turn-helix transcriptional regulator [Geodermatophilaceae bacterium]
MSQVVSADLETRIGYAAKRLQQAVRAAAERRLAPLGLTMPQYAVLSALGRSPGLSNSELARRCFVTRQSMNDVLAGLLRVGLVTRVPHPRDGRVQRTQLTVAAQDVMARGDQALAEVEEQMAVGLTESQRRRLLELMWTCTTNLEPPDGRSA